MGEYVSEDVYPILQGMDLYLTKGKAVSFNSKAFNQLKIDLREFEHHFGERRSENLDMVGTYRPYHFNKGNFGLYIYAEMFGMYILSIIRQTRMTLREAHTLALDSILTHGSFHYLLERYCLLIHEVAIDEEGLYPIYKKKIYSQTWGTKECLEETLANAYVFQAYPHWDYRQKDFLGSLYSRQRSGYKEAQALISEDLVEYREIFQTLEGQIRVLSKDKLKSNPSLYEYAHKSIPFRFMGLPVYLVNDCKKIEDFISIVQLLFPQI